MAIFSKKTKKFIYNMRNNMRVFDKCKISHFVLSRFNINLREYVETKRKDYGWDITEKTWMDSHLDAFEKTTILSLKNQTYKNFLYLCFFDNRTSQEHRNRIGKIYEIFPRFIPLYVDVEPYLKADFFNPNFQKMALKYVKELSDSDTKFIVQTRIDIDDYIHKDFILKTHEYAAKKEINERLLLLFPYGYNLILRNGKFDLWKRIFKHNQFCTFVEKYNDTIGVWVNGHTNLQKHAKKIFIEEEKKNAMWMWILHENNISWRSTLPWKHYDFFEKCDYDKDMLKKYFSYNEEGSKILV